MDSLKVRKYDPVNKTEIRLVKTRHYQVVQERFHQDFGRIAAGNHSISCF